MSAQWPSAVSTAANLYTTVNLLTTTLSGAINNAVATIGLASTTGFPTAGAVTIDNEVIFYTGISGSNLTGCVRGSDGTTAASHNAGVPVGATLVAYHVNALNAEVIAIEQNLSDRFGTGTDIVVPSSRTFTLASTTNQLILGATRTLTITAPTPASSSRILTIPDLGGDYDVVGTIGAQTIAGAKTLSSALTITPVSSQLVLGTTRTVTVTAPTPASASRIVTIPDLTGDYSLIGDIGTQTIGGSKTFSSAVTINPVSNQLVLGATRTVTVTAPTPASASRTWTIPDITADATFAALEGTQTFSGSKTFSANLTISGNNALIIKDAAGTPKAVTLKTPAALTNNWTLTLPTTAGSSNQYLTTDGSGNLSWTNAAGTGTVDSGTATQLAYYASSTNEVGGASSVVTDGTSLALGTTHIKKRLTLVDASSSSTTPGTNPLLWISGGNTNVSTLAEIGFTYGYTGVFSETYAPATIGYQLTSASGSTKGDLVFCTRNVTTDTAPTEALRIAATGRLGINTSDTSQNYQMRINATNTLGLSVYSGAPASAAYFYLENDVPNSWQFAMNGSAASNPNKLTLTYSGGPVAFTASTTGAVAIHGTTTNDNATAGNVGETVSSTTSGSFTTLGSSTVYSDLLSISLTAGDWLVSIVGNATGGSSVTSINIGISTTSGNSATGLVSGDSLTDMAPSSITTNSGGAIPDYRMSLSSTTTVYFKAKAVYATTAPGVAGRITAVRIR